MTPTTWFDPISERWITPRRQVPVPEVEGRPTCFLVSEAYIDALADAVRRLRGERIWKITRQVAEGCNVPTRGGGHDEP